MANQVALIAALKLIADAGKDVAAALQPGQSISQKVMAFENIIPDAMSELSSISDIGAEIQALTPSDYASLAGVLVADLGFSNPHAAAIASAGIKLLGEAAIDAPDVLAFIHAVKSPA